MIANLATSPQTGFQFSSNGGFVSSTVKSFSNDFVVLTLNLIYWFYNFFVLYFKA
jgi:hypothetical protein